MGLNAFTPLKCKKMIDANSSFTSFLHQAFNEDGSDLGDVTSLGIFGKHQQAKALWLAKEDGVFSGAQYIAPIFQFVDPNAQCNLLIHDGQPFHSGDVLLEVHGLAHALLSSERIALNLVQRMCGIATKTHTLCQRIAHTHCRLLDTRKTTPLLRSFEKEAVRHGGGQNHRIGLFDMCMIKDNHRDFAGGITPAFQRLTQYLKSQHLDLPIEIETRNLDDVAEVLALHAPVKRIMFDNFSPEQVRLVVNLVQGSIETEASGGINESNLVSYAETGVDFISMGALTHSVRSIDISMKAFLP